MYVFHGPSKGTESSECNTISETALSLHDVLSNELILHWQKQLVISFAMRNFFNVDYVMSNINSGTKTLFYKRHREAP